jgi:hypothetical protein
MADIFISYSRSDRARVQSLADALSKHGWSVWWDRQIAAGRTFDHVIADALAAARCVLVVWSKASIASDWVREEADEGRRRNILVPVLFDGVRPPLGFGRIQAADLGDWQGDSTTDAFRALIADITAMLGAPIVAGAPVAEAAAPAAPPPSTTIPRSNDVRSATVVATPRSKVTWLAAGAVAALVLVLVYRAFSGSAAGQPRPVTSAAEQPTLRLTAMIAEGSELLPTGVAYDVYEAAQDAEANRKQVATSPAHSEAPRFQLPAGRYYVKAAYGNATATTELEVPARTLVQQTMNLHAGVLRPVAQLSPSSPPLTTSVSYEVFEAARDAEGNRKPVTASPAHYDAPRFTLPAGRYHVTAQYGSASTATDVDVAEGENKALPLNLQAGVLLLSAVLSDGSKPLAEGVAFDVDEAAKDVEGRSKRVAASPAHHGPPRFPIPAGRYTVIATHGNAVATMDIALAAGETKRVEVNLHAGILALASAGPTGPPLETGVSYEVYEAAKNAEGARKQVNASPAHSGPPRFQLPRGRYYVTASAGAGSSQAEIEVPEGVVTTLDLKLAPGGRDSR